MAEICGGYVWVSATNSGVNALWWYVLKYVNKKILGKGKVYASILFASNKRMFSMSQNLLTRLIIRRNCNSKGWVFNGAVDEFDLKIFCQKEEVVFGDFIKVGITFRMIHEHPLIFNACEDE